MSCAAFWKYKGFLPAWEDLLSFSVPGGPQKINGLCLLGGGDKYPGWNYVVLLAPRMQLPAQSSDGHQSEVHSWQYRQSNNAIDIILVPLLLTGDIFFYFFFFMFLLSTLSR